jgi:hypothetical protein
MLQKDYVGARASLDRSMAINRNIGDTHGALAMLAILQGRAEESRQHGKRALALDPASFGARYADVLRKHPGEREVTEEALRRGFAAVAAPGGGSLADLYERMRAKRAQDGKGAKT